ncbi:MAG TPA: hypothetical protein VEY30_07575, partial [Myxococcaceae bacterium]|nr:hypothetical protein [Myxococcaceae bacterium]
YRMTFKAREGGLDAEAEVAFTRARITPAEYPAFRAYLGRLDQAFGRKVLATAPGSPTAARSP